VSKRVSPIIDIPPAAGAQPINKKKRELGNIKETLRAFGEGKGLKIKKWLQVFSKMGSLNLKGNNGT